MESPSEQRTEPGHETRLPFSSPRYRAPNTDDVRVAIQTLGLSSAAAAQLLGVPSAAVHQWVGGRSEIPYSAWRLLLIHSGLALDAPSRRELEEINARALADLVEVRDGDNERAR